MTLVLTVLGLTALVLSGCPANSQSKSQALTAVERNERIQVIAAEFTASGDEESALAALNELGLPNPRQSVLALAETNISQDENSKTTIELVGLAQVLGPLSRMAEDYLAQASGQPAVTAAQPTATPIPPAATPVPPADTPVPTEAPSDTPQPAATQTPTETPLPAPHIAVDARGLNVRNGPGTLYPIVDKLSQGDEADILARNDNNSWWQVALNDGVVGWVYGDLVTASGPLDAVAVAQNVAPPPATPTPAATPTPEPPPRAAVDFVIASQRLLHIDENQGCQGNHNIFVKVVDITGNPLNGVTVRRIWANVDAVSGSKNSDFLGRPDQGWLQFDLYKNGDQVRVARDVDGREVSSDTSRSLEVEDEKIGAQELMNNGYCASIAECQQKIDSNSLCRYHYSHEVIFQRQY